ncbi:2-polyprenyl-6-methoxyphenol hydroxylase-like FAD-dependent oxidoreductase [Pedobacter sp. UYEF25]
MNGKIIIIGAGIGGLSLAVQLAENNIACVVLETRTNFDGPTSGVRVSGQGVRIFEKMGIKNIGEQTKKVIMHSVGLVTKFKDSITEEKSSAIMVTRLAVHEKLMEKAKSYRIEIITGFKLINATEYSDKVEVMSENGRIITGKFLVGADGVGSIVRKILNPELASTKTYAGYVGVGLLAPDDMKIEMALYNSVGHNVGIASIGKINSTNRKKHVFLWTHIHIPEDGAKKLTDEGVEKMLGAASKSWNKELRNQFKRYVSDPERILAFGAVYNGKAPGSWYSDRMILIGDAAHPYGPGGQGISMALKDSEALCDMFVLGINEEKKANFQRDRSEESKLLGESAEARNSLENQHKSHFGIFLSGIVMKFFHLLHGGVIKSF